MKRKSSLCLLFIVIAVLTSLAQTNSAPIPAPQPPPSTQTIQSLQTNVAFLRYEVDSAKKSDSTISTYIIAFGSAAFGAFIGSLSAFALGRYQQKRDESNRNYAALTKTQFILFSQWKVVSGLKINHLDPFRDDKQRFPKVRSTVFLKAPSAPLDEIAFVTNSKTPNLLQEIFDAEN